MSQKRRRAEVAPPAYPDKGLKALAKEKEDNARDVIAEPAQFEALQAVSPEWLLGINQLAYETGMRQGEIRTLTWEQVDEKAGFLRLKGKDTKTKEGRLVPLSPGLRAMFAELRKTRGINRAVFLRDGEPIPKKTVSENFIKACKAAGIDGFRFHDFRHTAVTTMRRAGVDPLTCMQITGHKTMVCFTRYNSFREADLKAAAERANTYLTLAHARAAEQATRGESKSAASA